MTRQSTYIPHNPPLKLQERVRVVALHSPHRGRVGIITDIVDCHTSPMLRTDRWASDWYAVALFDTQDHFLEDELARTTPTTATQELAIINLLEEFTTIHDSLNRLKLRGTAPAPEIQAGEAILGECFDRLQVACGGTLIKENMLPWYRRYADSPARGSTVETLP